MKKAKFLFLFFLISILLIYILFIPEFKKSSKNDEIYAYLISDKAIKTEYLIKNNDEININLTNTNEFSLYLPYNSSYNWCVQLPNDGILHLDKQYIKNSRIPIYDWNKNKSDFLMDVLRFEKFKNGNETITFIYSDNESNKLFKFNVNFNIN